jgi:hypothetical protein
VSIGLGMRSAGSGSVKEECLSKVILFHERSLRHALSEYVEHFQAERYHQGKGNVPTKPPTHVPVRWPRRPHRLSDCFTGSQKRVKVGKKIKQPTNFHSTKANGRATSCH